MRGMILIQEMRICLKDYRRSISRKLIQIPVVPVRCQIVSGDPGIRSCKDKEQEGNYHHSQGVFHEWKLAAADEDQGTNKYQNHDKQCPQDKYPEKGQSVGRNIKEHPVSAGGDHQTGAGTDKGKKSLQESVFFKKPVAQKNKKDIKQTYK